MSKLMRWLSRGLWAATTMAVAQPLLAQSGAEFYNGKTVTYIVATGPGGGYDTYGRLVAEYMQKYLSGSTFIVKNIPGAGHLIGANTLYASKPDGLTIGTFNTGLIYNQLIEHEGVKFDLRKMSWIGKAGADPRVVMVSAHTPFKTLSDLRESKSEILFAVGGAGSATFVETMVLINALKLPAKRLTGYIANDDQMAMRRGEIHAAVGARSTYEEFVKNGFGRFIVQIGGTDKDVPQLGDLATDPAATALISLIRSQGEISRLTAGPPGIPADRLQALRTAYDKALNDEELRAKAAKLGRPVEPASGEEVARLVEAALNQTPETINLIREGLKTEKK
jgi:tripartite-type tricarboxylate transporter receptor subunit TctC